MDKKEFEQRQYKLSFMVDTTNVVKETEPEMFKLELKTKYLSRSAAEELRDRLNVFLGDS